MTWANWSVFSIHDSKQCCCLYLKYRETLVSWLTCEWHMHKRSNIKVRACFLLALKLSKDQETARRQLLMGGHFHASLETSSSHKLHPQSVRMYTWRGYALTWLESIRTLCNNILTWQLEFKISGFRARFWDFNTKRTRFQASCEPLDLKDLVYINNDLCAWSLNCS